MKDLELRQPEHTGRDAELALLNSNLQDLFDGKGTTVIVGGEAGIGKTRLVKELIAQAKERDVRVMRGWCLAETLEPLMPFKSALSEAGQEHLISGDPPPLVVSAYLINDAGLLLAKRDSEEYDLDSDIFTAMLKAVSDFVHDSLQKFGHVEKGGLSSIGFMDFNIVIEDLETLHLACVIKGRMSEFLIKDMRKVLTKVRDEFGEMLVTWDGDMDDVADIEPEVAWLVASGKYDGKFLVNDPRIRQENLFDNVLLGLRRLSTDRPTLIFLDDLQWADPTTLNLLHYLARNTTADPILIVGTYRPEDIVAGTGEGHHLNTALQNMNREGLIELIGLSRLGLKETETIITSMLGRVAFGDAFYERVFRETEGTPLFILEVVRLLVQDKAIQLQDGTWTLVARLDALDIPSKVLDVVTRRLDRLDRNQRRILDCASVMGVEFRSDVLGKAMGLSKLRLLEDLNDIENSHRLVKFRKSKYRFDHTKMKEVLYNAINPELRAEYHNMIGDAIEELHMDNLDEYVGELAHHYYEGGNERALRYLKRAGERAEKTNAYYEAIEFYGSALRALDFKGKSEKADKEYVRLSMKIGYLYYWLGELVSALPHYENALEAVKKGVDDEESETHATLYLARINGLIGNHDLSVDYFKVADALCDKRGDNATKAKVQRGMGYLHWRKGQNSEAVNHYNHSIKYSLSAGDIAGMARTFIELGNVYSHWGEHSKAIEYFSKSIEELMKLNDHPELARAYNNIGDTFLRKKEWSRAIEAFDKCIETAKKISNKNLVAWAQFNSAEAMAYTGELDRAEELCNKALNTCKILADQFGMDGCFKNLGIVYRLKGEHDRALVYLGKSMSLTTSLDIPYEKGTTLREMARTYEAMGDSRKAVESYSMARDLFRNVGSKLDVEDIDAALAALDAK